VYLGYEGFKMSRDSDIILTKVVVVSLKRTYTYQVIGM